MRAESTMIAERSGAYTESRPITAKATTKTQKRGARYMLAGASADASSVKTSRRLRPTASDRLEMHGTPTTLHAPYATYPYIMYVDARASRPRASTSMFQSAKFAVTTPWPKKTSATPA